jgi:hypothetical protein
MGDLTLSRVYQIAPRYAQGDEDGASFSAEQSETENDRASHCYSESSRSSTSIVSP